MTSNDIGENKKSRVRSAGFIIAAIVAILLIIAAFWGNPLSGGNKSTLAALADKLSEEKIVLWQDLSLHSTFNRLNQLDAAYGDKLAANASDEQLESLERTIANAEDSFRNKMDSFARQSEKFNTWANVVMADSISGSFRLALANRRFMRELRNSISGKALNVGEEQQKILFAETELRKKDERIVALENQLRMNAGNRVNSKGGEAVDMVKQENDALKMALQEEEKRTTSLLDITKVLKQNNESIGSQVASLKKTLSNNESGFKATKNRNAELENQLSEMEADLNFSRIDCNLTRADAKKIISNSRQRKELLADALRSLQNLSSSEDAGIQKKAKEKIAMLNEIASNLRD